MRNTKESQHKMFTEKNLQNYLQAACRQRGILCYKFSSPARRGVPDIILIHPRSDGPDGPVPARVRFIELKSPKGTGRLHPLQKHEIGLLVTAGVAVHVVDSREEVDAIMEGLL